MKNNIKRLLCGVLAAVVLVASAPAATPVAAATKAAATSSTPKHSNLNNLFADGFISNAFLITNN